MGFIRLVIGVAIAAMAASAWAQDYPTRPVRIVGSFAAGGILDLMARTVNERLGEQLGQPVVVEARPGADGSIGTELVARSAPDGYTLLFAASVHTTLPALTSTPWHPTRDFAGIGMVSYVANLLVIPVSLPPQTLKEFVEYAKARPGQLNALNGGTAGAQNMTLELFKRAADVSMTSVGYKGLVLGVPDLLNGNLHFAVLPSALADAHIKSGKLRPVAIAASTRAKQYPELPTLAEAGYPDASVIGWYALLAPAGTPRSIINRLNAALHKTVADPAVIARIQKLNGEPLPVATPESVDQLLAREFARWQALAKSAGLKIN
jgi:tripartite-type tricarboxylate transporter receptor subunit TctC